MNKLRMLSVWVLVAVTLGVLWWQMGSGQGGYVGSLTCGVCVALIIFIGRSK